MEHRFTFELAEGREITVTVGQSVRSDGAYVVFVDTNFEPDASDGSPGLRLNLNDGVVFEGVPFPMGEPEPGDVRPR